MDKAEIIKLLREYRFIEPQRKRLDIEMANLNNNQKDTLKAATISDMPSAHEVGNPTLDLICRYETMIEKYAKQINELLDKKEFINEMLNSLDALKREILISRYITNPDFKCDIFDWIGCQINYGRRQTINLYNEALEDLVIYCKHCTKLHQIEQIP